MSRLQQQTKPIIASLANDDWSLLKQNDIPLLAAWATMFTMVSEFADPDTAKIPQDHRRHLMEDRKVPEEWTIWIGRYDPGNMHPAFFNHIGFECAILDAVIGNTNIEQVQTTCFTVGRLLVQTAMVFPSKQFHIRPMPFAEMFDLQVIEPHPALPVSRPSRAHGFMDRQRLSNFLAQDFGLSTFHIQQNI